VLLEGAEGGAAAISGSLVLDATGHSRRLVQFDKKFDPGYQGAYGIIAGVCVCVCAWGGGVGWDGAGVWKR
jgi:hypothetical protein